MLAEGLIDDVGLDPHREESHRFLTFFDGEGLIGGGFDEASQVLLVANAEGAVDETTQDHAGDGALRTGE